MLLIVDDDPRFLEDAAAVLGSDEVWFAASVEQARTILSTVGDTLSVALVDLDLPGGDGFQFIRELRRTSPELPVIAMSGVSVKIVGGVESLRKPISSEWRTTINRALRRA